MSLNNPRREYITFVPYTVSGVPCVSSVLISNTVEPVKSVDINVSRFDNDICVSVNTSNKGFCCTFVFCCEYVHA